MNFSRCAFVEQTDGTLPGFPTKNVVCVAATFLKISKPHACSYGIDTVAMIESKSAFHQSHVLFPHEPSCWLFWISIALHDLFPPSRFTIYLIGGFGFTTPSAAAIKSGGHWIIVRSLVIRILYKTKFSLFVSALYSTCFMNALLVCFTYKWVLYSSFTYSRWSLPLFCWHIFFLAHRTGNISKIIGLESWSTFVFILTVSDISSKFEWTDD